MGYQWLLFLHVGSVLAFMLIHGVQVTAAWKMRWEPDPTQLGALFSPLPLSKWLRYAMLAVLASGLLLVGFLNIWTSIWIWVSLGLLVAIWALMYVWGAAFLTNIELSGEAAVAAAGTAAEVEARAAFDHARRSWMVPAMTVVGIGGVAAVLWLMIFKPF